MDRFPKSRWYQRALWPLSAALVFGLGLMYTLNGEDTYL